MTAQTPSVCRNRENPAAGLAKDRPVLYDRKNNKNLTPLKARQGACVVGRTANITKALEELSNQFKPQELNEANVQAIFNRCLAKKDTMSIARAQLFLINMGYGGNEDVPIHFDIVAQKQTEYRISLWPTLFCSCRDTFYARSINRKFFQNIFGE